MPFTLAIALYVYDAFNNNEVVSFVGSLEDELHNGEQAAVKLTVQCKNKPITSVLMQHNSASLQASIGRLENGPYTYSAIANLLKFYICFYFK